MNARRKPTGAEMARVDAMLADRSGQPRYKAPSTLHARTMARVNAEAARPAPSREAHDLTQFIWRLCVGAAGVGVVAAAWLFAVQVTTLRTPAPAGPGAEGATRNASLAALATIDERLFNESKAAATRIANAVSASYTREIDEMRTDARRAADAAAAYTRWMSPAPIAQPVNAEP